MKGAKKPPVVTAVRFNRDAKQVAIAGDDHFVRVYDLADGKQRVRLTGHTDWVRTLDYSADGTTLLTAGNDRRILAWNVNDLHSASQPKSLAVHPQAIAAIRCGRRSSLVAAVGFEATVRLYDLAKPDKVVELEGPGVDLRAVDFSPDDALVAAAGREGRVRVWSTATGKLLLEQAAGTRRIRTLVISPDGKHLVAAGDDRLIHVLPIFSQTESWTLPDQSAKVFAAMFLDNHQLATAGSDNNIQLWDIVKRQSQGVLRGHTGSIAALDCRGGRMISAGFDTYLRVWPVGEKVAQAPSPPPRSVRGAEDTGSIR